MELGWRDHEVGCLMVVRDTVSDTENGFTHSRCSNQSRYRVSTVKFSLAEVA